MEIPFILSLAICLIIFPYSFIVSTGTLQVAQEIRRMNLNESSGRRRLKRSGCSNELNPIDKCSGVCRGDWIDQRQKLAECGVGYGKKALGGYGGPFYIVNNNTDFDAVNPTEGTLRFGVLQNCSLWIVFEQDMTIKLTEELIMAPYKTIDARGFKVKIIGCSGITIQYVNNIIIHGLTITRIKSCGNVNVRSSQLHFGHRGMSDGDAISIFGSKNIWINHCTLSRCADGLIDVVLESTDVTITNCHFSKHNETILLGHSDEHSADTKMRVTLAYNHFAIGLIQRLPRARFCTVQLFNNLYSHGWGIYAVGGTKHPIIYSKGNIYNAPDDPTKKEVTYHMDEGEETFGSYQWSSENDLLLNGATFHALGHSSADTTDVEVFPPEAVGVLTAYAGAIKYN